MKMYCPMCGMELIEVSKTKIKGGIDEYKCRNCDMGWQLMQLGSGVIKLVGV